MNISRSLVLFLTAAAAWGQQPAVGPVIGLRLPFYDLQCQAKLGHPDVTGECYRYLRPNADQSQVDPDSLGLSVGIWSAKLLAAPGTANPAQYAFRSGFITTQIEGSSIIHVDADTAYMMHRVGSEPDPPPMVGTSCGENGTGAMWIGRAGLYVCVPKQDGTGFTWARANLQTAP